MQILRQLLPEDLQTIFDPKVEEEEVTEIREFHNELPPKENIVKISTPKVGKPILSHKEWKVDVVRVIDGDTFVIDVPVLPMPLDVIKIRVNGIDTPEKSYRAQCPYEKTLGEEATKYAKELLENATVVVDNYKWGKYGGRIVADVILPDGTLYSQALIAKGLAKEYFGGTKESWCE